MNLIMWFIPHHWKLQHVKANAARSKKELQELNMSPYFTITQLKFFIGPSKYYMYENFVHNLIYPFEPQMNMTQHKCTSQQ